MGKDAFNEAELFLIGKWNDVLLLEESVKRVRDRHKGICETVCAVVEERYPELDNRGVHLDNASGYFGLGKKGWPTNSVTWPSGFWIENINLDALSSEEEDAPTARIRLKGPKGFDFDFAHAKQRILQASKELMAKEIMTDGQRRKCLAENDGVTCLWYPLPESRQQLLEMLLKPQSREFIECLVSHFDVLAKLIPVIDEVFGKSSKRGRQGA